MTSATSASTSYVYRTVVLSVCPVYGCLDLTLVCCCQTVRWIEMKLDKEIGFGPGRIVLDGDPAPPKGHNPRFSAYVRRGQMTGWIKMPLGTDVV